MRIWGESQRSNFGILIGGAVLFICGIVEIFSHVDIHMHLPPEIQRKLDEKAYEKEAQRAYKAKKDSGLLDYEKMIEEENHLAEQEWQEIHEFEYSPFR